MRTDGYARFYKVQHRNSNGQWCDSALDHFLFEGLSFQERKSEQAARYRELLAPQAASSDLWQAYGINGYVVLEDVVAVFNAVRDRRPERKFRIVCREVAQATEVVT